MHDEKSWEDLLAMHDNVGKALRLFGISDFDDASDACSVLSAVIKKFYDPAERTVIFHLMWVPRQDSGTPYLKNRTQ